MTRNDYGTVRATATPYSWCWRPTATFHLHRHRQRPDVSTGTSVLVYGSIVVNTRTATLSMCSWTCPATRRPGEDSNTAADYLFLLNPTGNRTDSNNETYFRTMWSTTAQRWRSM